MSPVTGSLQGRGAALIRKFRHQPDSSARTLLITVFGDSIVPHGGEVWIGHLSHLVEPLGIDERLVRTSLRRLVTEGLLVTRKDGRHSYYSVSPAARHDFANADDRIYRPRDRIWDGRWTIVVETQSLPAPVRRALRQHLAWLGLGSINPTVHVCPLDRTEALAALLTDLGLAGQVAVFRGEVPAHLGLTDRDLVGAIPGDLDELAAAWNRFLRRFGPLADSADGRIDPEPAFLTRTLLVHAYRRIVLREPELPAGLWPPGWVGDAAYLVAARIYEALHEAAETHLRLTGEVLGAPLAGFDPAYASRYRVRSDTHS